MAYIFTTLNELAATYAHKRDQATNDADRIRGIIKCYEDRAALAPFAKNSIENTVRQLGGVTYLREVLRGHNDARVAWSTALEMLEGYHPEAAKVLDECECNGGPPCACPDCDHADCSYKQEHCPACETVHHENAECPSEALDAAQARFSKMTPALEQFAKVVSRKPYVHYDHKP